MQKFFRMNAHLPIAGILILTMLNPLTGCSSKPLSRKSFTDFIPVPATANDNPYDRNPNKIATFVGLSGMVMVTRTDLPLPGSNMNVVLVKLRPNRKDEVMGEITTNIQGEFYFSRKLFPGNYELRLKHKGFFGKSAVVLEDKPIQHILIEAYRVSNQEPQLNKSNNPNQTKKAASGTQALNMSQKSHLKIKSPITSAKKVKPPAPANKKAASDKPAASKKSKDKPKKPNN